MPIHKPMLIAAALATTLLASAPSLAEDYPVIIKIPRLTLEASERLAQATVAACRKQGIQIGVTVVDRDGTVQVQLRDTIAASITVPISKMKAFTAANFNAATSAMTARADTPIGRIDGLVMSAGGLPIQVGGSLLGAVGVSGAPDGATDEECAQKGVDAVAGDLELAD